MAERILFIHSEGRDWGSLGIIQAKHLNLNCVPELTEQGIVLFSAWVLQEESKRGVGALKERVIGCEQCSAFTHHPLPFGHGQRRPWSSEEPAKARGTRITHRAIKLHNPLATLVIPSEEDAPLLLLSRNHRDCCHKTGSHIGMSHLCYTLPFLFAHLIHDRAWQPFCCLHTSSRSVEVVAEMLSR